jgi:hypothetical protein
MREQELHIPKDYRTTRYTYYLSIQSEKGAVEKPFLDLFNSAEFEIIPCRIVDGLNIGHKFVILRFLFIDLWIIRVIKNLGLLTTDILNKKIEYIWGLIEYFRIAPHACKGFKYIGKSIDYVIGKRMFNLKQNRFPAYRPHRYLLENNKYKTI